MRIWFLGSLLPLMLVIGATKGSAEDPSLLVQEPVFPGAYDGTIPANMPAHDNSCAFAFNNVCDEPTKCKVGTDINDCTSKTKP
jgi:hypothetical protein